MLLSGKELALRSAIDDAVGRFAFHAQTLWLFSFSDLKTILIPSTIFGFANALAASSYGMPPAAPIGSSTTTTTTTTTTTIPLGRLPLILLWVWANYLPFAINNQLDALSIAEDAINKPWRPLPSGRIAPSRAKQAMLVLYVAAQLANAFVLGGPRQGLGLVFLGAWYNNFGGADTHPLIRNGINAFGYLCFISGAMEVALGAPLPLLGGNASSLRLLQWLAVIAGIIATTVHGQDMYDQEGDAARGRRTVPLVIGDGPARWLIAVWMVVWGAVCPGFWNANLFARALSLVLASLVTFRTVAFRTVASDKRTFLIWNVWVSLVFVLPLSTQM